MVVYNKQNSKLRGGHGLLSRYLAFGYKPTTVCGGKTGHQNISFLLCYIFKMIQHDEWMLGRINALVYLSDDFQWCADS